MNRLLIPLTLLVVACLVGCGCNSQSTQQERRLPERDTSTLQKALLGHWVSEASNSYFSEDSITSYKAKGRTEMKYEVISTDESSLTIKIRVSLVSDPSVSEVMTIKFASDYMSFDNWMNDDVSTTSRCEFVDTATNPDDSPAVARPKSEDNQTTAPTQTSPPVTTTPKVKTWQVVASWTGSGAKKTEPFTVTSSEWRISWSATSSATVGVISVTYYRPGAEMMEDMLVNTQVPRGDATQDTSYAYESGTFYLDINAANCNWTITVEENKY